MTYQPNKRDKYGSCSCIAQSQSHRHTCRCFAACPDDACFSLSSGRQCCLFLLSLFLRLGVSQLLQKVIYNYHGRTTTGGLYLINFWYLKLRHKYILIYTPLIKKNLILVLDRGSIYIYSAQGTSRCQR